MNVRTESVVARCFRAAEWRQFPCRDAGQGEPKNAQTVTDDDVAKHDNTLEPDPDPIVNGDDAGLAIALPMKRKIVDKDGEEGDDSSVTEKEQEPKLKDC